jgi:mono/diheme cytochrome c family protein
MNALRPLPIPVLLLSLTLAACGQSSTPTPPPAAPAAAPGYDTGSPPPAAEPAPAPAPAPAPTTAPTAGAALYQVVDGNKVDPGTLKGFRTWRAAACDRCHGANQEGMVGPSLIASLKVLSEAEFSKTVLEGRLEKGMPSFGGNPDVANNIHQLYAYLKGRSDGAITQAKVEAMP